MRKRLRILVSVLAAPAVAIAIYFEPTHCVRGRLWGEAFFEGRPTSWWRAELDRWEISVQPQKVGHQKYFVSYRRNDSWIDGQWERWSPPQGFVRPQEGLLLRLLHGGSEAMPVLQALHRDRSQKIRQFARHGLGLDAEDPEMP